MANVKISALPTWTGTSADSRWFVMNNQGQTETFKFSGFSSQIIPGNGQDSYVTIGVPRTHAPDDYMLVFGNHSGTTASSGANSAVLGGRNNRTTNQFGIVAGGLNNIAGYICGVFGGNGGNADGNTAMIIGGENSTCANVAWGGIFNGIQNYLQGGNDIGNGIIGGYANRLAVNGVYGSNIIGGRENRWHHFDSRSVDTRFSYGAILGGYQNRIEGLTADSSGANAYPIIIGGKSNKIFGNEATDSATTGATIINSLSSTITDSSYSGIFGGESNNIEDLTTGFIYASTNCDVNNASGGNPPARDGLIASLDSTINGGNRIIGLGLSGRTFGGGRTGYTAVENLYVYGQVEQQELVYDGSNTTVDVNIATNGLVELTATGGTYNIDIQPATSNIGLELTLMIHYFSAATINFVSAGNTQWKWGNGAGAPVFSGNNNYNILVFRSWDGNDLFEQSRSMWMS